MKPTSPGHGAPHYHHPPEEMHNEGVAHETSDVNVRAICRFCRHHCRRDDRQRRDRLGSVQCAREPGGGPRPEDVAARSACDPDAALDDGFSVLRRRAAAAARHERAGCPANAAAIRRQALHEYGWVDQKTGVAHVPIDQAKKLLAERGLPARPRRCRSGARHARPRVRRVDGRPLDSNRGTARSRTAGTRRETGAATLRAGGGA